MSSLSEMGLRLSKNALFSVFIGRSTKLLGRPFKVITTLNEVAEKLADKKSTDNKFQQLFKTALTLVRMVKNYINGSYREVSTSTVVTGFAVLLYVLSPIDLIPDFIPVVGFLDDLSLISWFAGKFQDEIVRFKEWEKTSQGTAATTSGTTATPDLIAMPALGDTTQPSVAELGHS
ncbi:YkvA family protein [Hymenobacter sp. B1770]|uniref:YkvA family protein n=1 Tax=Hymenobacter sp. B1770 TaxID=1718788 RepID=UPI003CE70363